VLERRIGDLIVVFLNPTGRMDPKMDNDEANALSRLTYAVFLIESGVADMVAIADAQVDSAKWQNVNMYCKKRDVTGFYGPTSNAVCKKIKIVSAQGTSSSTSGGRLILMMNMVAGHMCLMPQHQTVRKQLHISFDFMGEHLDTIVLYGVASLSTWQQSSLCSELAIALTRTLQECKGGALVMADTNSVWRTLDRTGGVKYIRMMRVQTPCATSCCAWDFKTCTCSGTSTGRISHFGNKEKESAGLRQIVNCLRWWIWNFAVSENICSNVTKAILRRPSGYCS